MKLTEFKMKPRPIAQEDWLAAGQKARKEREASGRTIKEVAGAMGISGVYLSELELGRKAWNEDLAERFTAALKA